MTKTFRNLDVMRRFIRRQNYLSDQQYWGWLRENHPAAYADKIAAALRLGQKRLIAKETVDE